MRASVHLSSFRFVVAKLALTLTLSQSTSSLGGAAAALARQGGPQKKWRPVNQNGKKKLLILGLGRVGYECGQLALQKDFDSVVGTVRSSPSSAETTKKDGIKRIIFDINNIQEELKDSTHVLWTIPLPRQAQATNIPKRDDQSNAKSSPPSPMFQLQEAIQAVRTASTTTEDGNNSNKLWTGFVSTTGVYGNHDGASVTEESECLTTGNAQSYLELESNFQYVFRCAGIYDSSRSALHTLYKNGHSTISSTTPNVTNRIHSLDIARAVLAAMALKQQQQPHPAESASPHTRTYNLADDLPATRNEVFDYASMLFTAAGVKILQTIGDSGSQKRSSVRARRRQSERKLVSNQRMKDELIPTLQYPTYKEGLGAILQDPETPWNSVSRK